MSPAETKPTEADAEAEAPTPTASESEDAASSVSDSGVHLVAGLLASLDQAAAESGRSKTGRPMANAALEQQLVRGRLGIASSLFAALRCKHPATAAHSLRVALGASKWAAVLKMPDPLRMQFEIAALLHDIGKIGVPDHILQKPGRLAPDEIEQVDRHPKTAVEILRDAGAPEAIVETITASTAWYDGGHRRVKLSGEEIPVFARMLAVVDAYDAMTTDHVYRPAKSRERAIAELFEFAGRQFDPGLVASFASHFEQDQRQLEEDVARRWLTGVAASELPWAANEGPLRTRSTSDGDAADEFHCFEQKLINNMHDGVLFLDAQRRILLWNTGAERLTGVAAAAATGKTLVPSLLEMADRKGCIVDDNKCPVAQAMRSGVQSMERLTVLGRRGQHVEVDLHIIPVNTADGVLRGATVMLHDASSEASLEEKCQALHTEMTKDPLTQVANRAEFDRMLEAFVDAHQETGLPCSLIMADIDHFKSINDTYTHIAGDQVIVSFAALLKSMCRAGDLVARYGGEEFAVLCADCNNANAALRAEQLRKALAEMQHSEIGDKSITASFGVTELQPGDTPETMLRRSDRALLMAKDQGRNQVVQLGDGMSEEAEKKSWWPFNTNWRGRKLVEATLVTNVPLEVAVQKLRGFIADHDAKILRTSENEIRLEATDKAAGKARRKDDRPVSFVVDVSLSQEHIERTNSVGLASGAYVQTNILVTIRPRRDRDRRRSIATDRARMLLGSLKSYLMAKEAAGEPAGAR